MKTNLVIMAAGMGSRFGGLKQAAQVGPDGQMIIDYSVYDAVKAGFDKAVIIIRHDIESDFRLMCGKRIEKMLDVEYVFQEKEYLPKGFSSEGRKKPWGTGHAVLCAESAVDAPFAIINADDFYGFGAYKAIHDKLVADGGMCMAGYRLKNTLSEHGTVSRGICTVENGLLKSVDEMTSIPFDTDLDGDTIVSMNMWGLDLEFFPFIKKEFDMFLSNNKEGDGEKEVEFFLPTVINNRINAENKTVSVVPTEEKWYGITYSDDMQKVTDAIAEMTKCGKYPPKF